MSDDNANPLGPEATACEANMWEHFLAVEPTGTNISPATRKMMRFMHQNGFRTGLRFQTTVLGGLFAEALKQLGHDDAGGVVAEIAKLIVSDEVELRHKAQAGLL